MIRAEPAGGVYSAAGLMMGLAAALRVAAFFFRLLM